jgi:hypothetical protein
MAPLPVSPFLSHFRLLVVVTLSATAAAVHTVGYGLGASVVVIVVVFESTIANFFKVKVGTVFCCAETHRVPD